MKRRLAPALVLGAFLLLATASSAFAHECFNASRSEQGNTAILHSGSFYKLELSTVFGVFLPEETGTRISANGVAWAVAEAERQGIPSSFVIWANKTIGVNGKGEDTPGILKNGADGHGIDHATDVYGAQIGAIYFAALAIP